MFGWREGILLLMGLAVLYLVATLVKLMRVKQRTPATTGFGEQFAERLANSEMEVEIRRLSKEMQAMRAELEELRAARHVSPHYAEAMELSQRGLTAQDVADRLGISLGEAELVHALSRGDRNFDEGEGDGLLVKR
ncbi:MAG: DUF2802 domain-containing protein [Rhodocyclaceae bacterium]|nr:DUF2802 domain-containing protein [Rhodocyclaceae bacterium]